LVVPSTGGKSAWMVVFLPFLARGRFGGRPLFTVPGKVLCRKREGRDWIRHTQGEVGRGKRGASKGQKVYRKLSAHPGPATPKDGGGRKQRPGKRPQVGPKRGDRKDTTGSKNRGNSGPFFASGGNQFCRRRTDQKEKKSEKKKRRTLTREPAPGKKDKDGSRGRENTRKKAVPDDFSNGRQDREASAQVV